jgi:amino acid transporter
MPSRATAACLCRAPSGRSPIGTGRRRSPSGPWPWPPPLATVYTPVYEILAAVTAIFLYISYIVPIALGLVAYGRSWTAMGPWHLGRWYRPLAVVSVLGCVALLVIGMQPPNEKAAWIVGGALLLLALVWFGGAKDRFGGWVPR